MMSEQAAPALTRQTALTLTRQELADLHECIKERMNALAKHRAELLTQLQAGRLAQDEEAVVEQALSGLPMDWRGLLVRDIDQKGMRLQSIDVAVCEALQRVSRV